MIQSLRPVMRNFGQRQRHTLPQVAITIAERAKSGDVDTDDTMDLYLEYYCASAGVSKADATSPTVRVNASKLRQIIKAADPALLREVSRLYEEMRHKVATKPLYHAMVDACRYKLEAGKTPSEATLRKILRKPKTK